MKLKALTGTMFSGKSTLLQKSIRETQRNDKFKCIIFKPTIDDRYGENEVSTHDGNKIRAIRVSSALEMQTIFENKLGYIFEGYRLKVFIDEVQFMEWDTIKVIQYMLSQGADVTIAGLDLDRFGKPFGIMPHLLALADEVVKLKTYCACGNEGYVSFSKSDNGKQVMVGAEQYEPMCKPCFYKQIPPTKLNYS